MRYRDASHVDTGSFYSRRHEFGEIYRLLGYAAILLAWLRIGQVHALEHLLILIILVWLCAWYQVVGTLWRSSLVAAMVLSACALTAAHMHDYVPAGILVMAGTP